MDGVNLHDGVRELAPKQRTERSSPAGVSGMRFRVGSDAVPALEESGMEVPEECREILNLGGNTDGYSP